MKIKVSISAKPIKVPLNKVSASSGFLETAFKNLQTIRVNDRIIWKQNSQQNIKGVAYYGEDEHAILFTASAGNWQFVAEGLVDISTPKKAAKKIPAAIPLDKKNWVATASVKDSLFLFSGDNIPIGVPAANAIDGDHWTGWRDMTHKQYPGQWLMVDMQEKQSFEKIELDNSWALWDSPKNYELTVSNDGLNWSKPIATGTGSLGITSIIFPKQLARYIRITQKGIDPLYHWSIYELSVFSHQ